MAISYLELYSGMWKIPCVCFFTWKVFNSDNFSKLLSNKWAIHFHRAITNEINSLKYLKELSELNTFTPKKRQYLPQFWSDKGFKGAVVNWTFNVKLDITLKFILKFNVKTLLFI